MTMQLPDESRKRIVISWIVKNDVLLHDLLCCRYCLFDQSVFSLLVVIILERLIGLTIINH